MSTSKSFLFNSVTKNQGDNLFWNSYGKRRKKNRNSSMMDRRMSRPMFGHGPTRISSLSRCRSFLGFWGAAYKIPLFSSHSSPSRRRSETPSSSPLLLPFGPPPSPCIPIHHGGGGRRRRAAGAVPEGAGRPDDARRRRPPGHQELRLPDGALHPHAPHWRYQSDPILSNLTNCLHRMRDELDILVIIDLFIISSIWILSCLCRYFVAMCISIERVKLDLYH